MHMLTQLVALAATTVTEVPDPDAVAPPGVGDKMLLLLAGVKWIAMVAAVGALIVAGVMLMVQHRRGEASESAGNVLKVLIGIAVVSSAAALVGWMQ
jgi:ABC-type Fe3+-siderophore transport system permease subunit